MTRLCLTLNRPSLEANLKDLKQNRPDLAELRIDLLEASEREKIASFPARAGIPLILTCRKKIDGGNWEGSELERRDLLLRAMDGDFAFVDLEEDEDAAALEEKAREKGIRIIRSFHDFEGVPADLTVRLEALRKRGDLVKAAVMTRSVEELITLFRVARDWRVRYGEEENLILLGMGPFGVPSRILAGRMGCYLTFCSPSGSETAPGHMSWETLHDLYGAHRVGRSTAVYGIIGNPVLHTRSPHLHNPGFRALGMDAVYVPFTVDDPEAFMELASLLDIKGCSVTVPHKEAVRPFLIHEDEAVRAVGACNTLIREETEGSEGSEDLCFRGANTDVTGFIEPLKAALGGEDNLRGLTAAVIGAGGAARSALYALILSGCKVSVFNRSEERALDLAAEFAADGASLEALKELCDKGEARFDLIIQTTSLGMHGSGEGKDPIPFYPFSGDELVYDIIYSPPETALMKRAAEAGCRVLGGMPMLKEQGRAQFRMFTGSDLPAE